MSHVLWKEKKLRKMLSLNEKIKVTLILDSRKYLGLQ